MLRKTVGSLSAGEIVFLKDGVIELHDNSVQKEFLDGLFKESDRSAVIVGASYFEELTHRKITLLLNKGNSNSLEALLDGTGPLSTFSARIHLLHCLGAISADAANDLNILRKLRNHCAHN